MDLGVLTYKLTESMSDYVFVNQYRKAVTSASNNIAEGFNRSSNNDFIRFLYYSKSSCSEVKSMTYLAQRIGYVEDHNGEIIIQICDEIQKILSGFIRSINQ